MADEIVASFKASIVTSPTARTCESWTSALVSPRMVLFAEAPAPETATPVAPKAAAAEAATAATEMEACSSAITSTSLTRARTSFWTLRTAATTWLSTWLRATAAPMDRDTPVAPTEAASEAAPASTVTVEPSVACTVTWSALMPSDWSPSISAVTSIWMRL